MKKVMSLVGHRNQVFSKTFDAYRITETFFSLTSAFAICSKALRILRFLQR